MRCIKVKILKGDQGKSKIILKHFKAWVGEGKALSGSWGGSIREESGRQKIKTAQLEVRITKKRDGKKDIIMEVGKWQQQKQNKKNVENRSKKGGTETRHWMR